MSDDEDPIYEPTPLLIFKNLQAIQKSKYVFVGCFWINWFGKIGGMFFNQGTRWEKVCRPIGGTYSLSKCLRILGISSLATSCSKMFEEFNIAKGADDQFRAVLVFSTPEDKWASWATLLCTVLLFVCDLHAQVCWCTTGQENIRKLPKTSNKNVETLENHQPPPHAEGQDLGAKADSFFPIAAALMRDAATRFFNRPGFKTLREVDRKTPGALKRRFFFGTWVLSYLHVFSKPFWERLYIPKWRFGDLSFQAWTTTS